TISAARTSPGKAIGTVRFSAVTWVRAVRVWPSLSLIVSTTVYTPARGKAWSTDAPETGAEPSPKSQMTWTPSGTCCGSPNRSQTPEYVVRSLPGSGLMRFAQETARTRQQSRRIRMARGVYHTGLAARGDDDPSRRLTAALLIV